ncbi:hypothetical protein B0T26DRAFT_717760 [Lasiosphaeria miniovina]|uniref:Uncharacterized protein n=1 Tax=Lasiosphaeria miniovina TaxID=1954250 RepID=A0AA40ACV4_9PEZI|nr:uncharacterized protein B0T26DRAFT_717760 [Lasiosphaeria miniovina]KAK0713551.1 hypothetical protein B0T26DRAFT_717760 [Lasiosphaeria miniovina]
MWVFFFLQVVTFLNFDVALDSVPGDDQQPEAEVGLTNPNQARGALHCPRNQGIPSGTIDINGVRLFAKEGVLAHFGNPSFEVEWSG